jgi:hypothetical protein
MAYYTGHVKGNGNLELLYSVDTPTVEKWGARYGAIIGPYKTKRAALWAVKHGKGNPHFQHVNDAERIASLV